jgi:hypothetical protein
MGSTTGVTGATSSAVALSGNWQISTDPSQAARLPQLSGSLTGTGSAVTGIFHATSSNECISPQSKIEVAGSLDEHNVLPLTSAPFASGSILRLIGTVNSGNRLEVSTYTITGGTCAFSAGATSISATAHLLQPVSGTYQGTFTDSEGDSLPITATLTQTTQPDSNGVFHVSGGATFDSNECISSPIVADSTVTGNTLSTTYTQQGQYHHRDRNLRRRGEDAYHHHLEPRRPLRLCQRHRRPDSPMIESKVGPSDGMRNVDFWTA